MIKVFCGTPERSSTFQQRIRDQADAHWSVGVSIPWNCDRNHLVVVSHDVGWRIYWATLSDWNECECFGIDAQVFCECGWRWNDVVAASQGLGKLSDG